MDLTVTLQLMTPGFTIDVEPVGLRHDGLSTDLEARGVLTGRGV